MFNESGISAAVSSVGVYVTLGFLVVTICIFCSVVLRRAGHRFTLTNQMGGFISGMVALGFGAALIEAFFAGWTVFWELIITAVTALIPIGCISYLYDLRDAKLAKGGKKNTKPTAWFTPVDVFAFFVFLHVTLLFTAATYTAPYTPAAKPPGDSKTITLYRGDNLVPTTSEVKNELIGMVTRKTKNTGSHKEYLYNWRERTSDGEIRDMYKPGKYDFSSKKEKGTTHRVDEVEVTNSEPNDKPHVAHQLIYKVPPTYKDGDRICDKWDVEATGCQQNAWLEQVKATIYVPNSQYVLDVQ